MARLTRRERVGSRVRSWATTVLRFWFSLQITQFGGQYSIERLLAPEEYTRKTSLSRVLLVLVVSPLPTLTIALCQSPFHCKVRPKGGRLSSRGSFSASASRSTSSTFSTGWNSRGARRRCFVSTWGLATRQER
ncbi:hypothetical protein PF010_g7949 [Phytophthora fragariae]|uniref:Uncharacterized protein n=1 Tax=Phytophthora fragariae TaxID=53985 RepID=A0A6A3U895_9STRA|nr:hypothetical protein PF003_g22730 [Phytophthora fragariae]KAE9119203.1 hypothetical protein PF010_g7949 [Phytophthora fragariae]KAE9119978.1 hypothetical protein PF007_g8342 [Phytophthora fragariae]KAE9147471.1 hypothetical protein PF006_g7848 [Phytophthora fragariae]KAE9348131.1 hypothetical protein PF008_g7494 [Phytophthora fragariae]